MTTLAGVSAKPAAIGGATLVGLLAASHAAADVPFSAISAMLPMLRERFGLTESMIAVLVATLSFSASMTQPVLGTVADRIGARVVGAAGVTASSALLALVGIAPSLWVLVGLLVTGGLASAAMHPALASTARRHGGDRPGFAVSLYSAGGTFGVAIGPVAVLAVMSTLGVSGTPWLMMPGILLGAATYLALPDAPAHRAKPATLIDLQLIAGPVGALALVAILAAVPFVAFGAGIGLWLVVDLGVPVNAPLIGWTLSAFAVAAATGGLISGAVASRIRPARAVSTTMLAASIPLFGVFAVDPGTPLYFAAVTLAGALLNASLPVMVVTAQTLVPRSVAAASGMMMGFAHGVAGLLYIGVGRLQEAIGIETALSLAFLLLLPAALLAYVVLTRIGRSPTRPTIDCSCRVCRCAEPGTCACVV